METETKGGSLLKPELSRTVIGAFYATYNELGPGFPETVTRRALAIVLREAGLPVLEEVSLPVWFRGQLIANFRADMIVANKLIVEVKVAAEIAAHHRVQLLHYLKATDLEIGFVMNFGRVPQFSRVVYENARKRKYFEPPGDSEERPPTADIEGPADPRLRPL